MLLKADVCISLHTAMNLLLLHGALGSREQLATFADVMPTRSLRQVEFSGHGEQPRPDEGISFAHFVEDIGRAVKFANGDEVHLFGYSMGGYAALLYAAKHPDKVASVTTLGTKFQWDREGLDRELRLLDPQKMKEKVPQFAMDLLRVHGHDRWEQLVYDTAALITSLHREPLLSPDLLAKITCPVMLCVGDRDRTAVPEHTLATARLMPRASTLVLPATQHPADHVDLQVLLPHLRSFWGLEVD
jgi:pimeloyl-ACP methyl ester carboxylesterase